MSAANPNWARWVFASVSKHFDDRRSGIHMFIEGQHRDTRELKDYFELRVDGPTLLEVSKGCWKLRVEVNILATATFDEANYHTIHTLAGIAQAAFTTIEVYKYGINIQDDQTFLGCLILRQNRSTRDFLELNHFGRIDVSIPLMQATVEGHYTMTLNTA